MTHFIVRLFYRMFWRQINVHDEKCVNCNEAAIGSSLSALKLKLFASLVKWCTAHYTRHMKGHVSLRVVCESTHRFRKITGSVNEPKSNDPGMIPGTHYPCIFRNLCVKEAIQTKLCFKNEPHTADLITSTPWAHVSYSSYRQDISASFFISGRYLHLKPLSADSDTGPLISCIPPLIQI